MMLTNFLGLALLGLIGKIIAFLIGGPILIILLLVYTISSKSRR